MKKIAIMLSILFQAAHCDVTVGFGFKTFGGTISPPYDLPFPLYVVIPQFGFGYLLKHKRNIIDVYVEYNWGIKGNIFGPSVDFYGYSLYANYNRKVFERGKYGISIGPSVSYNYELNDWIDTGYMYPASCCDTAYGKDEFQNLWLMGNISNIFGDAFFIETSFGFFIPIKHSRRESYFTSYYSNREFKAVGKSKFEIKFKYNINKIISIIRKKR